MRNGRKFLGATLLCLIGFCQLHAAAVTYTGKATIEGNGTVKIAIQPYVGKWSSGKSDSGKTTVSVSDTYGKDWTSTWGYTKAKITYLATADKGWIFSGWYDDNDVRKSVDNPYVAYEGKSNNNYVISLKAKFEEVDCPASITKANANDLGIQTGTVGPTRRRSTDFRTIYPYYTRRDIDVTAAFDNAGNALFDYLYILGPTDIVGTIAYDRYTAEDGKYYSNVPKINIPGNSANAAQCNAKTPCYVYNRNTDGKGYTYSRAFDAVQERIGTLTNGKSYYITGFCPFACTGTSPDDEGFIYAEGKDGASVDIYLDNCVLHSKNRTRTGRAYSKDYEEYIPVLFFGNNELKGFGSPLVFYCTGSGSSSFYKPRIHIINNNELVPANGHFMAEVKAGVGEVGMMTIMSNRSRYCAPITCKTNKDGNNYCLLQIDDKWPNEQHMNGFLELHPNITNTGSVDLGNSNSSVTFDGGQYELYISHETSDYYASSLAICYRKYTQSVEILGSSKDVSLWHFGGDQADCSVHIKDGTFNASEYQLKSFYADSKLELRLPGNSKVDGGTFNNCEVFRCTKAASVGTRLKNSNGDDLCPVSVYVGAAKNANGTSTVTLPEEYSGISYNTQSVNADAEGYVHLLLPRRIAGCEPHYEIPLYLYTTCMGELSGSSNGYSVSLGGDVETVVAGDYTQVRNYYLAYITFDQTMKDVTESGDYQAALGDAKVAVKMSSLNANIKAENDYDINRGLYILMPIPNADEWFTFTAPFDIKNVYVVETYCDKEIEHDGLTDRASILRRQAYYNLDMGYDISYQKIANKENQPTRSLVELIGSYLTTRRNSLVSAGVITRAEADDGTKNPILRNIKLLHYNGTNIRKANYYLYYSEDWSQDESGNFTTGWKPVPEKGENGDGILMKRGETYILNFPFCPGCNDHTKWDYWTGKYLLLEGEGPQTIYGKNKHAEDIQNFSIEPGKARLKGNYTFADCVVSSTAEAVAFMLNKQEDMFEAIDDAYSLKPTKSFLCAYYDKTAAQRMRAISRTGQVIYGPAITTDNGDSHLPTIAGNATLMVQQVDGGMEVIPLQPQRVDVVAANGQLVYSGILSEQTYLPLPAGIYMVRGEKEVLKVLVR